MENQKRSTAQTSSRAGGSQDSSASADGNTIRFMSTFAINTTITIFMSPLRKGQAQILAANLIAAGAHVMDPLVNCAATPKDHLLVVTDCLEKARLVVEPRHTNFSTFTYVSTKWASKTLLSESPLPTTPFLLIESKPSNKKRPKATSRSDVPSKRPRQISYLPIWCRLDGMQVANEDRVASLPEHICQRATFSHAIYPCPNQPLCDIFESLAKRRILEEAGGSSHKADIRARAYRLAASALKQIPFRLTSKHDAAALHSFGPRVLAVVNEYLTTGVVTEVQQLKTDARLRALTELTELYSVGSKTARHLVDDCKIRSVSQLRKYVRANPDNFGDPLVRYLEFYDDAGPVDLATAREFEGVVTRVANQAPNPLHLRVTLCGGFRRCEPKGHDVDLVYSRAGPMKYDTSSVLSLLIGRLSQKGLLACSLSIAADQPGHLEKNYFGESKQRSIYPYAHDILHAMARFRGKVFRLDIVGVRRVEEYPFATLAWSGSTPFQRSIRQYSEQRGLTFNQHGLFDRITGERVKLEPIPGCEADVFHCLKLVYRPPYERC